MSPLSFLFIIGTSLVGIATSFIVPVSIPKSLKILIGPALGCIVLTNLILLSSLGMGFNHLSILTSLALYAIIVGFIASRNFSFPRRPILKHIFQAYWPLWTILATLGSVVTYIYMTQVLAPSDGNLMTGTGGLFGDTAMHSAFTMSLVEQGIPPRNPLFTGNELIYPFLVNLFSASLVKLGMSLRWAFVLPQLIYFVGVTTLIYALVKKMSSNMTALFTFLIFFLGWGWGFTVYLSDVQTNHSWDVTREYTNNLENFHMHNVLTGIILPARSFLPGLVIGLLITHLIIEQFNNKTIKSFDFAQGKQSIFIGVLLGSLLLWHTHTFIFVSICLGSWYLYHLFFQTKLKTADFIQPGMALVSALAVSAPILWWFSQQVSHTKFLTFSAGWMDAGADSISFWIMNTGLVIPLALLGWYKLPQDKKWFFIPVPVAFLITNIVVFQPWNWDNIKIFSWIFLFAAIPAAHFLHWLMGKNILFKGVSLLVLATLIFSGSLSLFNQLSMRYVIYDAADQDLATWARQNTKPTDTFLVDPWPNHPITGLSGRTAYIGYPGHLWVHGIDYGEREALVRSVLQGNTSVLSQSDAPINYMVVETAKKAAFTDLTEVYSNNKFAVYKIR